MTSTNFKIRDVIKTDFSAWLKLWEGYNTFYKRKLPLEITEVTWSRFLDITEPMYALVAEQNRSLLQRLTEAGALLQKSSAAAGAGFRRHYHQRWLYSHQQSRGGRCG